MTRKLKAARRGGADGLGPGSADDLPEHLLADCLAIFAAINALVVVALVVPFGLDGPALPGPRGFVTMGAYPTALLTTKYEWSSMLALIAGMLLARSWPIVVGVATLRLQIFDEFSAASSEVLPRDGDA